MSEISITDLLLASVAYSNALSEFNCGFFSSVDHLPLATFWKKLYLDQLGIPPGLFLKANMNLSRSLWTTLIAKYICDAFRLFRIDYWYIDLNISLWKCLNITNRVVISMRSMWYPELTSESIVSWVALS